MVMKKPSFIDRLKEGFEIAQKPIAFIVMLTALMLDSLPSSFLPPSTRAFAYLGVLLVLALILMKILFEIYEKVVKDEKKLDTIESGELYASILNIVSNERSVTIKCLGVAGRNAWTNVLEKLLDENNSDSLIANRTKFDIDISLLNPEFLCTNEHLFQRFGVVTSIANSIEKASSHLIQFAEPGSSLKLHFYEHMPNMLGFLINNNYLFVTYAYCEHLQGEMTLRAGGTNYFVYDKNDKFGGQDVIRRFIGWNDYIIESSNTTKEKSKVEVVTVDKDNK